MHDLCVHPDTDRISVSESLLSEANSNVDKISALWLPLMDSSTNYFFDILIRRMQTYSSCGYLADELK